MNTIIWAVISAVGAVAVYAVVTDFVARISIRRRREAALKEAAAEGEMIKKEKILQAKEKFMQLKSEHDRQCNERNQKIAQSEQRARQLEQNLQNQQRDLDNRLRENERLKEQMHNQMQVLEHKKSEIDQMMREQNVRLEQISGMSSEDAKNILIENMKAEAKSEAAAYINETIEEAKMTASKEAKRIIVASIQRVATETAIENAVTVFNIESDEVKGRIMAARAAISVRWRPPPASRSSSTIRPRLSSSAASTPCAARSRVCRCTSSSPTAVSTPPASKRWFPRSASRSRRRSSRSANARPSTWASTACIPS